MEALFLLIPLALVLLVLVAIALWIANRSGQFDDLVSPGIAVLLDDDSVKTEPNSPENDRHRDQIVTPTKG